MSGTVTYCPICVVEIARTYANQEATDAVARRIEWKCRDHFAAAHPWRLRLHDKTGWKWPIRGLFA